MEKGSLWAELLAHIDARISAGTEAAVSRGTRLPAKQPSLGIFEGQRARKLRRLPVTLGVAKQSVEPSRAPATEDEPNSWASSYIALFSIIRFVLSSPSPIRSRA